MTARDLIGALLRRWYLVVLGGALTLATALLVLQPSAVYFSEFEVTVLPPKAPPSVQNTLRGDTYGLVPIAGLLVTEFNDGRHPLDMSTKNTTLFGEGQFEGYRVRLVNEGNQWARQYPHPIIDVQVVYPDAERVTSESLAIVAKLQELLKRRQDALPPATRRASLVASPADPVVFEITGSRSRAAGGLALLGGSLTLIAVVWVERRSSRRATAAASIDRQPPPREPHDVPSLGERSSRRRQPEGVPT